MALDRLHITCECESAEHQLAFIHDKEDDSVYLETHLVTHMGFFVRLWVGLRYAFGYKCKYGNFDHVIISRKDRIKLVNYLQNTIKAGIEQDLERNGYDGC